MDFKKLAGQAGQMITRAVQYTEEKLGNAEKTEFDAHYDSLVNQYESSKLWTEKLMSGAQAVIIPNPGNRVEDLLFEKIEKRRPNRLSNLEYLGLDMVQAGNEYGPGTSYGAALLKVGGAQQRLGLVERDFVNDALEGFVQPLHKFLDTEMRTIARERKVLDNKRLDLDVCKNRLRKARSMDAQTAPKNVDPKVLVMQAETDLHKAQMEFDRQTEITKLLLEGLRSSQASHLAYLNDYVKGQAQYYEKCHQIMTDLMKEMDSPDGSAMQNVGNHSSTIYPTITIDSQIADFQAMDAEFSWRRAKVVCNYEAAGKGEISLKMHEEVMYDSKDTCVSTTSPDFILVKRGSSIGQVPRAYIEPLDD